MLYYTAHNWINQLVKSCIQLWLPKIINYAEMYQEEQKK